MDRSRCAKIVDEHAETMLRSLGIPHWRVQIQMRPEGDQAGGPIHAGECKRWIDYERAIVWLNPEAFDDDDEAAVLGVLRHEFLHIVLGPMDLYANAVGQAVEDERLRATLESVWTHAMESTIRNLERLCHGLTAATPTPNEPTGSGALKCPKKASRPRPATDAPRKRGPRPT